MWIGLHEPTPAEFTAVSVEFELHPLAVEDAIKAHQRSKLERYGDCLFLVFKTARYDDDAETIEFSEIQLFAGDRFVITVRHGAASALSPASFSVSPRRAEAVSSDEVLSRWLLISRSASAISRSNSP